MSIVHWPIDRLVVALNNAGVSLLRRQLTQESMETFHDTLKLLRAIEDNGEQYVVDDCIQKMNSRIVNAVQVGDTTYSRESDGEDLPNVIVNETDIVKQFESMDYQATVSHICIVLDEFAGLELSDSDRQILNCATLLYNYAIALQIHSGTAGKSCSFKLSRESLQLLKLAKHLVDDFKISDNFLVHHHIVYLKMLVTRSLTAGSDDVMLTTDDRQAYAISFMEVAEIVCKERHLVASLGPRTSPMA